MSAPIHINWWNRPGWGEFLALRGGKPTHGGFDSYTEPKATIYGTAENGTVIAKGFVGGMQWGYYIDVYYPKAGSRLEYVQRDCHLHEMAGIAVGAPANPRTAFGRVGRSGNAKDIFWPASTSPNGRELWHVHSECYLGSRVDFSKRVNPHSLWGSSPAGGGFTPIIIPEPEQEGVTMTTAYATKVPAGVPKADLEYLGGLLSSGPLIVRTDIGIYALCGDSPGTLANVQLTQLDALGNAWAADHTSRLEKALDGATLGKGVRWLAWPHFMSTVRAYLTLLSSATVTIPTGLATTVDVDAAAARVIEAIPTTFVKG